MELEIAKDHDIKDQLDEMDTDHANGRLKAELIGFANSGRDVFYRFTCPDDTPKNKPMDRWFLRRMYRGTKVDARAYQHRVHLLPWPEVPDSVLAIVTPIAPT
jgi:hypothetical protein